MLLLRGRLRPHFHLKYQEVPAASPRSLGCSGHPNFLKYISIEQGSVAGAAIQAAGRQ